MQAPALPPDEHARLDALRGHELLDTLPERAFDDLTTLATQICDAPISMISLVDEERQWFKSKIGIPVNETPRDVSFCGHAILQSDVFVIPDATCDPRFADNPWVTGDLHVRFYAGAPLVDSDGHRLGTLCLMDRRTRQLTRRQEEALRALSRQVVAQINLRRQARDLHESEARLRLVTDNALVGLVIVNDDRRFTYANSAYLEILGLPPAPLIGKRVADVLGPMYDGQVRARLDRAFAGERIAYELRRRIPRGETVTLVRFEPTDIPGGGRVVIVVMTDITAQKDAATASRRMAAIVESSDDAIIGKDLNGVVTSWNRGAENVFGYTAAEMVGDSLLKLVPPERLLEEDAILARIRRGESVEHMDTVRRAKDGRLLNVSVTSSPIRDDAGVVIGASKVARDVTAERRDADRLREREEQLRLYAEHSPVAVAMFDCEMRYCVASRSWLEDFHLGDRDIVGLCHYDVFPDIPERWREIHRRCLAGAIETCHEDPFVRADGQTYWLRWAIRPWHISSGPIGGIIVFCEDITARKDAETAVHTTAERTRFALESAGVGIWDADYTTGVVRWSEILERHAGLGPGTFGGTFDDFITLIHPDDRAATQQAFTTAMQSGPDFSLQHRFVRPDGSVRWMTGAGRVQHNLGGEPIRAIGILLDVTARHTLEAQYQQAQKMEAIGRLAGGIAHDFNNLLTAILGYSDLALGTLADDDQLRGDIMEIHKAGTSAAVLTRQLLAFSRKEIIEPSLLDINDVISAINPMLGRLIGKDVKIVLLLSSAPAIIMADRGQVEQVLMNLVINAHDAMPKGGTLTIQSEHVRLDEHYTQAHFATTPGAYVALTVSDTGVGITADAQAHLFEPFFTTKEVGKGTGLGLATVHGIVARCGGSVGVYSELGTGTSFKVYFPSAEGVLASVDSADMAESSRVVPATVLVVEDAPNIGGLARRLLESQGYTVLLAATAEQAVGLFDANVSVALLLTDVVMPGTSGPELAALFTARRPDLKVIYMSGYTEDVIVQHGVLKPGVTFIHKPFTSDTLLRKVRDALEP
ncbi:MAG: PAS domain S-box protein [Acidobacteriota bacterium]